MAFEFTWDEIFKMWSLFNKYDRDHDGVLTDSELLQILRSEVKGASEEDARWFLKMVDSDNTGTVSFEEYVRGVGEFGKRGRREQKTTGQRMFTWRDAGALLRLFQLYDENGNGFLSFKELYRALHAMDPSITTADVTALIKRVDCDRSGFISFDEFLRGIAYSHMSIDYSKFMSPLPANDPIRAAAVPPRVRQFGLADKADRSSESPAAAAPPPAAGGGPLSPPNGAPGPAAPPPVAGRGAMPPQVLHGTLTRPPPGPPAGMPPNMPPPLVYPPPPNQNAAIGANGPGLHPPVPPNLQQLQQQQARTMLGSAARARQGAPQGLRGSRRLAPLPAPAARGGPMMPPNMARTAPVPPMGAAAGAAAAAAAPAGPASEGRILTDQQKAQALKAFNLADKDGSGTIDANELYDVLKLLLPAITKPEAQRIYHQIDSNRSGSITFDEFLQAVAFYNWDLSRIRLPDPAVNTLGNGQKPGEEYEWEVPFSELEYGPKLGEGTFGVVYKAKWRGMTVAVKELKYQKINDEVLEDFRKEISILGKLRHPNVILFMGACTKPPHLCMITEFMSGGSLYDAIHKRKKKFDYQMVIKIARQTSLGLNYLHLSHPKIVHRDLKSLNLLVDEFWNVKICDFGLSCVKPDAQTLTEVVGTPLWMAPELLRNESYNEKADVYAFAICVWELLTGQIPFAGFDLDQIVEKVANKGYRPKIPSSTPKELAALLQACWDNNPSKRPSFAQIITILDRLDKSNHE